MKRRKIQKCILWTILCVIILFCSSTYIYKDIIWTQRNSIDLLHVIFDGKFRSFFLYCEAKGEPAIYDLSIYIIFAIWNIPCFIYERITGMDAQMLVPFLLWGKALVLGGFVLFIYEFKEFCSSLLCFSQDNDSYLVNDRLVPALCLTPLFLLYTLYTGTYDIIGIILIVKGISCLFKGNEKQFVIWFSIATSIKYFAVLVFIPLILIREKKISRLIIRVLECISVTVVEKIIMIQSSSTLLGSLGFAVAFTKQGGKSSMFSLGDMSMFLLCYCFLCLYCYLQTDNSEIMNQKKMLYVITFTWTILVLFININSYWIIYIIPFLIILVFYLNKNVFLNVILELIFSCSMFTYLMLDSPHIVRANTGVNILGTIIGRIVGRDLSHNSDAIGDLLVKLESLLGFGPFIVALAVGSLLALMLLNYPSDTYQKHINEIKYEAKTVDILIKIRNVVGMLIFISPVAYFCIAASLN